MQIKYPNINDLNVFLTVTQVGSFSKASQELSSSQAYVSKRISLLEKSLNQKLLYRDAHQIKLTEDGEKVRSLAETLLSISNNFLSDINENHSIPHGKFSVCSTFGIGRKHVSNALSTLMFKYPDLLVRLDLTEDNIDIISNDYDMEIRVGYSLPENRIAKLLCENYRVLCASPEYINKSKPIVYPEDLINHSCIMINEKDVVNNSWVITDEKNDSIKIIPNNIIQTNSSEVATRWAIDGHGIVLRSIWDARKLLDQGCLINVLPKYRQEANVYAIYAQKASESLKMKTVLNTLVEYFKKVSTEFK